ncbi:MAG: glycosyltransferase [Chloroflexi bacterium]|nr:glycosyltransferase [Chloroflexota bacterium]
MLGGIENHLRVLAEGLAKRGHEVSVIVCHPQQRNEVEMINGVRVIRAARVRTIASTPLSFDLPRLIAQEKPDITHLQFPYPIGEVSHWLVGHGRTVITYQSDVVRQRIIGALYKPLMRQVLRRADSLLATSPNYVVSSTELVRLGRRCLVLPLGINTERFAKPPRVKSLRPTLLFIGRHRYYKGVDDLLKAMTDIEAELIIGGDGVMRESWERLAASLNLNDKVRFIGTVPESELPSLYRSADIFVLPASARSEAFGLVLLEAMAAGLPCVTTELGTGTSYVVQHNVSGLVAPARTPSALAESINHLLADESLRKRMGEAGQERARKEFTETLMVERIENVYKWVVEQN